MSSHDDTTHDEPVPEVKARIVLAVAPAGPPPSTKE